ncbi:hypothetical protein P691DRAFT_169454 [Macrolepiota fuliginosa MF-IS2]|uniref:Uncharacterized protein n=1 Tax=Macrolepiota fuliginosa MF-IS2 TaxID=1400762 RepID=A0A9P5X909_9AGAR|nr:hypothetical protein P691DRAFT_169454 [Macrolepiota fuliginosa MF-IS2]
MKDPSPLPQQYAIPSSAGSSSVHRFICPTSDASISPVIKNMAIPVTRRPSPEPPTPLQKTLASPSSPVPSEVSTFYTYADQLSMYPGEPQYSDPRKQHPPSILTRQRLDLVIRRNVRIPLPDAQRPRIRHLHEADAPLLEIKEDIDPGADIFL